VTRSISSLDEFAGLVGADLGYSDFHEVDQATIDLFADATGDHQWIHVDPVKSAQGPYGATIAHGYLTLALIPAWIGEVFVVENLTFGVNYGCNKVRFPAPVTVGSRLRLGVTVASVEDLGESVQVVLDATLEAEAATKPACVAQVVYRYYR